jgi:hypothetical protein
MNRLIILGLLLALLYALYTYQQQILNLNPFNKPKSPVIKQRKRIKKGDRKPQKRVRDISLNNLPKDDNSLDKVSLGGISQVSLGSLADLESYRDIGYKQDSAIESLESRNSLGSLISQQSDDFFF